MKLPLAVTMDTMYVLRLGLWTPSPFQRSSWTVIRLKNFWSLQVALSVGALSWLSWPLSSAESLCTSFSPWIFCPVPFCFPSLIWLFFLFGKWKRCRNKYVFSLISFLHPLPALQKCYPSALQFTTEGPPEAKQSIDLERHITVRAINFSPSEYTTYHGLLSCPRAICV